LAGIAGIFAAILFIVGWYGWIRLVLAGYVLYSFLENLVFPIDTILTNQLVDPKKRATVLSIKSVIENLASIVGAPLI
jgi:DHA3 family tetracycline resistance protein-like MFS transporter